MFYNYKALETQTLTTQKDFKTFILKTLWRLLIFICYINQAIILTL